MSETPESPTSRTSPSTRSPWAERQLSRRLGERDIQLALASGDVNPAHLDAAYATDMFHRVIAHGHVGRRADLGGAGHAAAGAGHDLPVAVPAFCRAGGAGDVITAEVTVTEKDERHGNLTLACRCTNQAARGDLGEARSRPPPKR
jgi:acyl dehydratase